MTPLRARTSDKFVVSAIVYVVWHWPSIRRADALLYNSGSFAFELPGEREPTELCQIHTLNFAMN